MRSCNAWSGINGIAHTLNAVGIVTAGQLPPARGLPSSSGVGPIVVFAAYRARAEALRPMFHTSGCDFTVGSLDHSALLAVTSHSRGIAPAIPERDDQIAHRRKKPGRPIDFGDQQQGR